MKAKTYQIVERVTTVIMWGAALSGVCIFVAMLGANLDGHFPILD